MFLIPKTFFPCFSHYIPISCSVSGNIFISGIMKTILLCPVVFVQMLGIDDTIMLILYAM